MHPHAAFMQRADYVATLPASLLVPHYLLHCAAYYRHGSAILDDSAFDALAARLAAEWEQAAHRHRDRIERDALRTSGYYIDLPLMAVNAARNLLQNESMTPASVRQKGQKGERDVAKLLQPSIDKLYTFHKKEPPQLSRNLAQTQDGGFDLVGLDWLALEVKHHAQITPGKIADFWAQTLRQAKPGQEPVCFFKQDRKGWQVMLNGLLPGKYSVAAVVTVSVGDFVKWFEYRLHAELEQTPGAC